MADSNSQTARNQGKAKERNTGNAGQGREVSYVISQHCLALPAKLCPFLINIFHIGA